MRKQTYESNLLNCLYYDDPFRRKSETLTNHSMDCIDTKIFTQWYQPQNSDYNTRNDKDVYAIMHE